MNKKMIYKICGVVLCLLYFVLVVIFANSEYIKTNVYCEFFLPFILAFCLIGGIIFFILGFRKDKKSKQFEMTSEIAQGIVKRTEKLKNVALILLAIGLFFFLLGFINENIAKVGMVFFIIGVYTGIFAKESKKYKEAQKYLMTYNQYEITSKAVPIPDSTKMKNEKIITPSVKPHKEELEKHNNISNVLKTNDTKESSVNVNNIKTPLSEANQTANKKKPLIIPTHKMDAIESLRSKILNEIIKNKSTEIELASLLWDSAANCFPTGASWNWDGAWFKLDLITKKLFVEVSTYPNQFGASREDRFSISTDEFSKIVNRYRLGEELAFIRTDEDLDMIFDEKLKSIISDTEKMIQREKEEQQNKASIQNSVVLPNELKKTAPSMELSKVKIELNQRYGNSNICLVQDKGEYCLEFHRYSHLSPNSNTYNKKLSLQESVWVEEQVGNTLENKDKTTWQSLPGGDTMTIEIERLQGENVNMVRCMPLNKYMDLLHKLEKLAQYGSRFE